jgi:hypothetical protein
VVIWISGAKYSPKGQKHRTPINGKFNDIGSAHPVSKYLCINLQNIEINQNIAVEPLFKH